MEANDKRRNSRCSTLFLCYYDWTLTKKQLEEERVSLAYTSRSQSTIRDAKGRTWGRDQKGMLFPALLAPSHSAGFLIPSRTTCLGEAPLTLGWALLTDDQSSQPDGSNSQLQVPSSQVYVHLTKTSQHSRTPLLPAQLFRQH